MLGSATPANDWILLKSTAGGGGVGISCPEMLKEVNLGGGWGRTEPRHLCVLSWASLSEVGWDQLMLLLATCRSPPLAKQTPEKKRVPAPFRSI